ncbi:hypothetical protein [Microbacterium sp. MPKO10]|uniref:hypothetical protein n=1 Tax=Microbacterium sp. MPKO10 TaxID=2989818 RepID=UPI0022358658|nr:hypothetical protein [Microbacterium sp. MPKO10]MCW4458678.1 hypothetical protein [Microbacterium sp. MPKO10]
MKLPVARFRSGRLVAGLLFVLVALALFLPAPQETEASWTDSESVAARFTAAVVPAPVIQSCSAGSLLNKSITVKWTMPPSSGYGPSQVSTSGGKDLLSLGIGVGLLAGGSTSGPDGTGVYTTQYSQGLLSGLLGLGGPFYLGIYGTTASGWDSPLSVVKATPALLGLTSKCELVSGS